MVYASVHRGRFYATLPARTLAEVGFVFADQKDSVIYSVPDAELLLSDEFVNTHCFQAVSGREGLVGLAFEPVSGRRVAEVQGTLWVQRETGELKFLEYSYTGLPSSVQNIGLGGRVEYRRLPTGSWIVSYWHVRTPKLEEQTLRGGAGVRTRIAGRGNVEAPTTRLAGFVELGGRIRLAADSTGPLDRAIIRGRVMDSTSGGGLGGVVLQFKGDESSAITDSAGRFELALAAHGDQELVARHPKLSVPGVRSSRSVLLSIGDTTWVEFTVPHLKTLGRALCGRRQDRAGVIGVVLGPDGTPVEGAEVLAEWRTAAGTPREVRAWSEREGVYALCNLPPDEVISVQLLERRNPVSKQSVELEWGAYRWLDLRKP